MITRVCFDRLQISRRDLGVGSCAFVALLLTALPARAASLQPVADFGSNPTGAKMFVYVPDKLAPTPPILVALHYCGGNANAFFNGTGYRGVADQYGFLVIYPEVPERDADKCWDVNSDASLKHEGNGHSTAIVSMVKHAISQYSADADRVYVTGTSSGAMMTNVLLGAYPDVFKAGAAFAGVPYGCFAGPGDWNNACASGQVTKTGQAWGDLVRAAYPGYDGARPRMQLWHGTSDETLDFHNFGEEIKQWTNVLGVDETPTATEPDQPQRGWTRTRYADACGIVRVEAVREDGQTHNLSVPANEVIRFFALDGKSPDPGAMGCDGAGGGPSSGDPQSGGAKDGGTSAVARDGGDPGSGSDGGGRGPGSATGDAGADASGPRGGASSGGGARSDAGRDAGQRPDASGGGSPSEDEDDAPEAEDESEMNGDGCGVAHRRRGDASGALAFALALASALCGRRRRIPRTRA